MAGPRSAGPTAGDAETKRRSSRSVVADAAGGELGGGQRVFRGSKPTLGSFDRRSGAISCAAANGDDALGGRTTLTVGRGTLARGRGSMTLRGCSLAFGDRGGLGGLRRVYFDSATRGCFSFTACAFIDIAVRARFAFAARA